MIRRRIVFAEVGERLDQRDRKWRRAYLGGLRRAIGEADRADARVEVGAAEIVATRHHRAARRTQPREDRERIADPDIVGLGCGW